MDCKTARRVWNHKHGFLAGLKSEMPGLFEHLSSLVASFKRGDKEPFDLAVKRRAGNGPYQVSHADEDSELSRWKHDVLGDAVARRTLEIELGRIHDLPNLRLGNICCKGCITSIGALDDALALRIQLVAVNTNPDGSTAS